MNEITIEINKQDFAGGETIVGEVIVQLDQDTPLRGIRLLLKGYEESSWREGSGKHRHTHSEKHDFFDQEITLQGRPRLGLAELVTDSFKAAFSIESYDLLHAGIYRYPFTFVLPPDLPGDYESSLSNSRICYCTKAQVDLPLKLDLDVERSLTVYEPANTAPVQPVTQRHTKKFLFDSDALVEVTVHLDKDIFFVGEELNCHLEVMNRAPEKEIRAATFVLRQLETAYAQGRTHEEQAEITRTRFEEGRVLPNQQATMDLKMSIPSDLYPTIAHSSLVKLDYELLVTLDIPWAVDAKFSVPLKLVRAQGKGDLPPIPL